MLKSFPYPEDSEIFKQASLSSPLTVVVRSTAVSFNCLKSLSYPLTVSCLNGKSPSDREGTNIFLFRFSFRSQPLFELSRATNVNHLLLFKTGKRGNGKG
ncbi:MAG: hypothetical protein AAGE99_03520 [Chlamydiota bacterium]